MLKEKDLKELQETFSVYHKEYKEKANRYHNNFVNLKNYNNTDKKRIKEKDILKTITIYLQIQENMGKLMFIRNNRFAGFIERPNGTKGYIKNTGAGSPDLIIFCPKGKTLIIEVKTEKGRQNEHQKAWHEKKQTLGFVYIIVRDIYKLQDILKPFIY